MDGCLRAHVSSASRFRMKIIAVNRFYAPDHSATAQLLTDLAEYLAAWGGEVVVITSRQRYDDPAARLAPVERLGGITVRRVWTSRFGRRWLPGRALDYLSFYLAAFAALVREARAGDTILAKTDPPLLSVVAWLAARLRGARLVNWCQDLFPEVAAALGLAWAAGPVGQALRGLRNRSLRAAAVNVVPCERMAQRLATEGVPPERIAVIHNWADRVAIRPIAPERNPLRREWGLAGRRVIGYSGNLGRAHDLPAVRTFVAAMAVADPELVFLFVGGGAGLTPLTEWARARGLRNMLVRPYQPRERLAESLSVPDLHLVSLDPACEGLIMPSKLYSVLAAGRPVVALGAPNGALAELVRDIGCGLTWAEGREGEVLAWLQNASRSSPRLRRPFEARFARVHALRQWRTALALPPSATTKPAPTSLAEAA
jgi:colanic acid biosynthesis glycosyl transferase WcaI